MRILGIDPGLNTTGYGVLDVDGQKLTLVEAGVVRSTAKEPLSVRVAEIHDGVADVIRSLSPEAVAIEELYSHYARPQTAILMGHARGVICLAAAESDVPVFSYSATQIKKIMTGSGHASKEQMQQAVCRELKLLKAPEPHDVADALAIAICHAFLSRVHGGV